MDENNNGEQNEATLHPKTVRTKLPQKAAEIKAGDRMYIRRPNSEKEWSVVKALSRGGKKTGAHPNYWNVINVGNNKNEGIDLDLVEWIKCDDTGNQVILFSEQIAYEVSVQHSSASDVYNTAKETEHCKWKEFNAYEEVCRKDFPDIDVLSCRWITSSKETDGELIHKARLVVRGFEEFDAPPSDSPTAQKSLIRMCIILCNWKGWEIQSLDVRSAFLQSNDLDRIILMKPPKEFRKDSDTVWRIKKPIYGLNDGARKWFITIKSKLVEYGCKPLKLDPSVYIYHHNNELAGFCVVHVDDCLTAGNQVFKSHVLCHLCSYFSLSSKRTKQFKYVGWNINQQPNSIEVDQIDYQKGIEPIEVNAARMNQPDQRLNQSDIKNYQQLLGKLQWLSSQSRPDIRFTVLECSLMASKPRVCDVIAINKVVKKAKKDEIKLVFNLPQGNVNDLSIVAFSDAALSNLPDKTSSTRGYAIFLKSGHKFALLNWGSRKMERVAKTIIYAEGIALGRGLDEAINLREILIDILNVRTSDNLNQLLPVIGVTDSKSLWDNIKSSSLASDLKLRREVAAIREQITLKEVSKIVWSPSHQQLADCLTKKTASPEALLYVLNGRDFHIDLDTNSVTSSDMLS